MTTTASDLSTETLTRSLYTEAGRMLLTEQQAAEYRAELLARR